MSVRDSAAILDATRGPGAGDPYSAAPPARPFLDEVGTDPGRLRIAWTCRTPNGAPVEADARRVLQETAALAVDLGHQVEEADPVIDGAAVVPTFLTLMAANTVVNLSSHPSAGRAAREDEVERITWLTAKMGEATSGADYVRATQTMHRLGRQMAAFHGDYDILLTPGLATGTAVKLGWLDMMMDDVDEYWRRVFHFSPFTVWFNLTGQPAIMLPIGRERRRPSRRGAGRRSLRRRGKPFSGSAPSSNSRVLVRPQARDGARARLNGNLGGVFRMPVISVTDLLDAPIL